jgi:hypothetical protein
MILQKAGSNIRRRLQEEARLQIPLTLLVKKRKNADNFKLTSSVGRRRICLRSAFEKVEMES